MLETAFKSIHNWRRYIPPQSATKLTKTCGGALLWRRLTSQRRTAIWVHNCSLSDAQQPQRYFVKFTSSMTFGAHNLVRSELFLDYMYEI